jgi:hypothetical protein
MTYDYQLVSLAPYDYHPGAVARHNPPVRIVTNPTQPVLNRKRFLVRLHHLAHQMKTMRGLSLRYIDIRQPGDIVAVFDEVRARVGILDSTAETRVERLFAMIPTIVGMLGQVDGVDLRWNQQVTLHRNAPKTSVSSSTDEPDAVAPAH